MCTPRTLENFDLRENLMLLNSGGMRKMEGRPNFWRFLLIIY